MAADARPYKSKEQDGNGNEIILRDQQLVEQSSQTTMASTEYFEIVDVDGRMAKIPKDNMIGVVREALGTLLNGLADQTTVAKFLTLNGNTLGASAAATAASVLGGIPNVADSTITDFNSVNYSCITTINGTNVQNSPKNGWGCFVCIKSGAYCPQMFFVGSDRSMYYRTSNNGDWIRSYDNTILSDSTILSPLASALGVVRDIGTINVTNINDLYENEAKCFVCFYAGSSAPSNLPTAISTATRFFVEQIKIYSDCIQRITKRGEITTYQRTTADGITWTSWTEL